MLSTDIVSNQFLYTTARLAGTLPDATQSVGTAFFFSFKVDETKDLLVLITNMHVVRNTVQGEFWLHEAKIDSSGSVIPTGRPRNVTLDSFADRWVFHPGDIDLCAMPVGPIRYEAQKSGW